jgi:ribonuclease P protein component
MLFFIKNCLKRREETIMKKTKMLKKNYEFRNVLSKGTYYSGQQIEAFIKTNNRNQNFLGIAIGVKIAKATKRNKIKRLIRENYKNYESTIKQGYSIVFLWKKKVDTKNATFENIKKDMQKIFDKAKILNS